MEDRVVEQAKTIHISTSHRRRLLTTTVEVLTLKEEGAQSPKHTCVHMRQLGVEFLLFFFYRKNLLRDKYSCSLICLSLRGTTH